MAPFLPWFSFPIWAAIGVSVLLTDFPNGWLKLAVAFMIFATAIRPVLFASWTRQHIEPIVAIRVWMATNALAWAFGLIGSLTLGGALGWVCAFLCLYIGVLRWGWLFHQLRAQPVSATRGDSSGGNP
jgi:hypothetical protein